MLHSSLTTTTPRTVQHMLALVLMVVVLMVLVLVLMVLVLVKHCKMCHL